MIGTQSWIQRWVITTKALYTRLCNTYDYKDIQLKSEACAYQFQPQSTINSILLHAEWKTTSTKRWFTELKWCFTHPCLGLVLSSEFLVEFLEDQGSFRREAGMAISSCVSNVFFWDTVEVMGLQFQMEQVLASQQVFGFWYLTHLRYYLSPVFEKCLLA